MEFNKQIPAAGNQLPAVYGDGIFPQLGTIVARYNNASGIESVINKKMASVRQSMEHMFGLHKRTFNLFSIPNRFKLLVRGYEVYQLTLVSFFILNCFTCFNETSHFLVRPPTLQEYIPLSEDIPEAPEVNDEMLGNVYRYY
jgi:hypothetical protein